MPRRGPRILQICRRRGISRISPQAVGAACPRHDGPPPSTPAVGPLSGNEIKWIWHLERALGEAAVEIALLVSDIGDDRIARRGDLAAFLGLEGLDRGTGVVVGARDQLRPAFVSGALKIPER